MPRRAKGTTYNDIIDGVLNVHGRLGDGIVLGIDNVKQTQCSSIKENEQVADYLIKSRMNDLYGELRTEDGRRIIDESAVVCVFGLSLGMTDNMWWSHLLKWLEKDSLRRLVIFTYSPGYRKDIYSKIRGNEQIMSRLAKMSGYTEAGWEKIKNRVYIGVNPQIFNMKLC